MEEGIARIIYVFGELTKLEAAITTVIAKSKIPTKEIRVLLRSFNRIQVERTPLFQYMKGIFRDLGLGDLRCEKIEPFEIVLGVYNSKVPRLFSDVKGKKTCYITADMIKMFFEKDMDMVVDVKEIMCVNEGNDHCEFSVRMNPPDVLKYVIDNADLETLKKLKEGEEVGLTPSLSVLKRYGLVDDNGRVTILGEKYLELGILPIVGEVERPWKKLSEISEVTASAKSFAEAFSRTVDEEVEEVDEELLVNVVEETEKSRSFAELVAKFMKKEVKDDE